MLLVGEVCCVNGTLHVQYDGANERYFVNDGDRAIWTAVEACWMSATVG